MEYKDLEFELFNYYVVEVKQFKSNPSHRAIVKVVHKSKYITTLNFLSYEDKFKKSLKDLYEIKIIREIVEMNRT